MLTLRLFWPTIEPVQLPPDAPHVDTTKRLLHQVWSTYGKYNAVQLSNLTHLPDTPWDAARKSVQAGERSVLIPDDRIEAYFKANLERNRSAQQQPGR